MVCKSSYLACVSTSRASAWLVRSGSRRAESGMFGIAPASRFYTIYNRDDSCSVAVIFSPHSGDIITSCTRLEERVGILDSSAERKRVMSTPSRTAAGILAAGTSSRMGEERNKLLLPLHHRPVLAHVIEAVLGSRAHPLVLVLGYQAREVRAHIQRELKEGELEVIENPDYAQGQSTSMKAGLRALLSGAHQNELDSVIFLLGDQPMITSSMIDKLIALKEESGKRIVLPLYQGQRGNPVIFSLDLAPELQQVN